MYIYTVYINVYFHKRVSSGIYIFINLNQIAKQIENLDMSDGTSSVRPGAVPVMSGSVYIYVYIYMCVYIYIFRNLIGA